MQAGAAGGELAQVGDRRGGDALAGQQGGDAGRVAGDRLAGDASDGVVDADLLGGAEERLARRDHDLVAERGGRRDDRRGGAGLRQPLDDLVDVAGQAPQRGGRFAEPDDEHDRGLHRQLGVHVVGAPQRVGDLIARAARAAHVEHDPQRVIARHAHAPDQRRVDQRDPRDRLELGARDARSPRSVSYSSCSPCSASCRRAPSSEGQQQRRRARGAQQPQRARDRARVHAAAVADVQHRALRQRPRDLVRAGEHRVRALRQRGRRQVLVEPEVRAPRLVDDQRHARPVRDLRAAGDVRRHPVVRRRHDERRPRIRRRRPARAPAPPASRSA